MRLSNIEIKDIHNGLYREIVDRSSKLLVLNTEGGQQINILLGVARRETPTQNHIVALRTPHRYLYQVHIAIYYDIC